MEPCELIGSKEIADLEYDMRENFDLAAKRFSEDSEYESDDTTVGSWSHCDSISVIPILMNVLMFILQYFTLTIYA